MEVQQRQIITEKIIRPNQPGTKKLVERFGNDLICVRYRYDKASNKRLKTVELIVEQRNHERKSPTIPRNKLLPIRVNYRENEIRRLVKSAGGRWDNVKKVWELSYGGIIELGLQERILRE
jgi:hypothetical protein